MSHTGAARSHRVAFLHELRRVHMCHNGKYRKKRRADVSDNALWRVGPCERGVDLSAATAHTHVTVEGLEDALMEFQTGSRSRG